MIVHYAFGLTEENMPLVTFLNDGIRPTIDSKSPAFLAVEINGPCEITTKVLSADELKAASIGEFFS